MIIDSLREYSVAQGAITATAASTNKLDGGSVSNNIGTRLMAVATVAGTGAGTIQVVLQDSADNSSFADVLAGAPIVGSTIAAGDELINVSYPKTVRRYTRLNYVVVSTVGAVKVNAFDAIDM